MDLGAKLGLAPLYATSIYNLTCVAYVLTFPLQHKEDEALSLHSTLLSHPRASRTDPMPWLVLFLRRFLKFFCKLAPYILHHSQLYNVENAKLLQSHDCGERVFDMACRQEVFQGGKL